MPSLILCTAARLLLPLLLLFSIFVLARGHNEPGGGFVGGLVAAAAYILYAIAYDPAAARHALRIDSRTLIGIGLLVALVSGMVPLVGGEPFMRGLWSDLHVPVLGKLGTPLFFDIGVYFAVLGVTLTVILGLAEEG